MIRPHDGKLVRNHLFSSSLICYWAQRHLFVLFFFSSFGIGFKFQFFILLYSRFVYITASLILILGFKSPNTPSHLSPAAEGAFFFLHCIKIKIHYLTNQLPNYSPLTLTLKNNSLL